MHCCRVIVRTSKVLLVVACLVDVLLVVDGTLTKSDKKVKKKKQKSPDLPPAPPPASPDSATTAATKRAGSAKAESTDSNSGAGITYSDIVLNYDRVDYSEEKKFPNPVLGYVTPWNNHGYDVAKWLAHKFTHISPVWFQVVPSLQEMNRPSCAIQGVHDMDQGWIADIRKNNSAINIVPRFLFERWGTAEYRRLFGDELEQERCTMVITDFIQRNRLEGGVVELWSSVMTMSQGIAGIDLIHFVTNMAEIFDEKRLIFVLPVPPPLEAQYRETGYFTAVQFAHLAESVHYFNIMTYDHPNRQIGPLAPIEWVRKCIEYLTADRPELASKIFMGVNFYGHEQSTRSSNVQHVTGNRYIEILKSRKPDILWSKAAAEHYLKIGEHTVYYPSLVSIEARLNLARNLNVGVGIWETGQGLDYFYNLF